MQVRRDRVNDHRDQRPGLLRVPAPVTAPGLVGPDGAEKDAGGQQHQPDEHRHFVDDPQFREVLSCDRGDQRSDAAGRADTEKTVAGGNDRHVDHQPVGFQHRYQRGDLRVEPVQVRYEQDDPAEQRGQREGQFRPAGENDSRQYGCPSDVDHRFVSVRPGGVAADVAAQSQSERMQCENDEYGDRNDPGGERRSAFVLSEHPP